MTKRQAQKLAKEIAKEFDHVELIRYDTGSYAVSVGDLHGKRFDTPEAWTEWVEERDRMAELYS